MDPRRNMPLPRSRASHPERTIGEMNMTASSVTTTLVRLAGHPGTRAAIRCALGCAWALVGSRPAPPQRTDLRHTPSGYNERCS